METEVLEQIEDYQLGKTKFCPICHRPDWHEIAIAWGCGLIVGMLLGMLGGKYG